MQPNILAPIEVKPPELKAVDSLPGTDANDPQNYLTSCVPESFMDVMMVNGTVYPYLNVEPKAYRFRLLNASNDRFINLQLYLDASGGGTGATGTAILNVGTGGISTIGITNGGSGYVRPPGINITGGGGFGAMASATISGGVVTAITITNPGSGYTSAPTVTIGATTEVSMVGAVPNGFYPATWPKDGRDGGVPDPATAVAAQLRGRHRLLPARLVHHEVQPEAQRVGGPAAGLRQPPPAGARRGRPGHAPAALGARGGAGRDLRDARGHASSPRPARRAS